jgi:hypothetical protein
LGEKNPNIPADVSIAEIRIPTVMLAQLFNKFIQKTKRNQTYKNWKGGDKAITTFRQECMPGKPKNCQKMHVNNEKSERHNIEVNNPYIQLQVRRHNRKETSCRLCPKDES